MGFKDGWISLACFMPGCQINLTLDHWFWVFDHFAPNIQQFLDQNFIILFLYFPQLLTGDFIGANALSFKILRYLPNFLRGGIFSNRRGNIPTILFYSGRLNILFLLHKLILEIGETISQIGFRRYIVPLLFFITLQIILDGSVFAGFGCASRWDVSPAVGYDIFDVVFGVDGREDSGFVGFGSLYFGCQLELL